jgi:hypothetical protein
MHVTAGGYSDFEVLIAAQRTGAVYPVTVIESPAGQAEGEFRLPMPARELEALVERIRALDTDEATLTNFGGRLFSALFQADVLSRYAESVGMTSEGRGLRLRLHVEPAALAALPWELLYDPEKREFVGLSRRALITRYLHVPRPPSPLRVELPLHGQLVVAEGPLAGLRFPLLADTSAVLGRSSKAGFTLRAESVSRQHAEVKVMGAEISIRDLGSTNGTQVNGKRIGDWQRLADGDQVVLGDVPLTVQLVSRTTAGAKNAPTS